MRGDRDTVMHKAQDRVISAPPGGPDMEELGILVPVQSHLNVKMLAPVRNSLSMDSLETIGGKTAELCFLRV